MSVPQPHIEREHWDPIPGFEDLYEVSTFGRVRSVPRWMTRSNGVEVFLQGVMLEGAWKHVNLCDGVKATTCMRAHLVLETFDSPSNGRKARHIDGDRNNSRLENLEWV